MSASRFLEAVHRASERVTRMVLRHRVTVFCVSLGLSLLMLFPALGLRFNNSNENFYPPGDQTLAYYDEFKERFGSDEFVYILFSADDMLSPGTWKLIGEISEELGDEVPFVREVTSLPSLEMLDAHGDELTVSELMEPFPETREEISALQAKVLRRPLYADQILSRDGRFSAIVVDMEIIEGEDDPRKLIAPKVREILGRYRDRLGLEFHAVGIPIIDYDMDVTTANEVVWFGSLSILFALLLIGWLFRSFSAFLVTCSVVVCSIVWVFGLMAMRGQDLSLVSVIIPSLLVAVGLGDAVHLISEFRLVRQRIPDLDEALVETVKLVGWPCLLTSVTTSAGLISFRWAPVMPVQQLGVLCCFGVGMAFILTFTLGLSILALWPPAPPLGHHNQIAVGLLGGINRINERLPRLILGICGIVVVASYLGVTRIRVETSFLEQFELDSPIRRDYTAVNENMGGPLSVEIIVGPKQGNASEEPALSLPLLRAVERFQESISKHRFARGTTSLVDIIKELNRTLMGGSEDGYRLPERQEAIPQYLLLYEISGGDALDRLLDFSRRHLRISVRAVNLGSRHGLEFKEFLDREAAKFLEPYATVEVTGTIPLFLRLADLITTSQIRSLALAFVLISIMMIVVFGSLKMGLVSLLPNLLPVFVTLGYMGWSDTPLDLGTVLIACVAIGVAVDDTIHFFSRFQLEFLETGNYREAINLSILHVGRAMFFTSLLLTISFGTLGWSEMGSVANFGILTSFTVVTALVADYFLAPQLLVLFKPLGKEGRGKRPENSLELPRESTK